MSERMTREQVMERLSRETKLTAEGLWAKRTADLIMAVQTETELRVFAKCAAIAESVQSDMWAAGNVQAASAAGLINVQIEMESAAKVNPGPVVIEDPSL